MFKKMAQNIAKSTSEVIGCGVLVTDEHGMIVGCDDESRIGTFHEPSIKVMAENQPLSTTAQEAEKIAGVFPGYTLPIRLMERVVGSVSITGAPEEVARYGTLVQKQSEIMLREQAYLESSLLRERALRDLVENVVSCDGGKDMCDLIDLQGRDLGFNLSHCRVGVEIVLDPRGNAAVESSFQTLLRETKALFSNPRNVIAAQGDYRISLLFAPRSVSGTLPEEQAEGLLRDLYHAAREKGMNLYCACGLDGGALPALGRSLATARKLARMAPRLGAGGVFSARYYGGEIILDSLPAEDRRNFARQVLGTLPERADYGELCDTFMAWCESPFAMAETAAKLSMHRNSLQYRLKKIRSLTGKDPWNFRDAFELWSAFVIMRFI